MTVNDLSRRASETVGNALANTSTSRRSFLVRAAVFGSALASAPIRFLLEPGDALARVTNCPAPGGCGSGLCTDGYSAFCCTLPNGTNNCPSGTHVAGWWHACVPTNYCGSGTRYYLDCIGNCPTDCSQCHCAYGSCSNRRVCCNHGYRNCGGSSTAYLRCRIVRCVNPCNLFSSCSCTSAEKDRVTCHHGSTTCLAAPGVSCETRSCTA
jgi:hypothetical protein